MPSRGAAESLRAAAIALACIAAAGPVAAQSDNVCDAGESPDLIVGEIRGGSYWGTIGGISAYSFGTASCNLGTCQADWIGDSSQHPVIAQNLFRLKDGRFEHIGQSWVKHGFATIPLDTCSPDCLPTEDDQHLGVNCSDPYGSSLNGYQPGMGRKSDVKGSTGEFPWPVPGYGTSGDAIFKRLQVHDQDLDPALNAGALYFVEAQYVALDDARGGKQDNNASYISASVSVRADGTFGIVASGATEREKPAILAWRSVDPAVRISEADMAGRYYVGARVTDLGNGTWRYEYAIENLNADGALGFAVPVNGGSRISNLGFHDVDYHSGEPHDNTDWPGAFDPGSGKVLWSASGAEDNNLLWGTLYNFRFDADRPPVLGTVTIRNFVDVSAEAVTPGTVQTWVPLACDDDGTCDPGEDCHTCPGDCAGIGAVGFCGDGICDVTSGEDCVSCASDCNGAQGGNPGNRFCCGDGAGENPVPCTDPRCNAPGFVCASPCCGDGFCDYGEGRCDCGGDCGLPTAVEVACQDGVDDDCDGSPDCADLDCCTAAACADGIDGDGDSVAECDCNDASASVWSRPGEARDVRAAQDPGAGASLFSWSPPADPGATSVTYEVLRSGLGSDFVSGASCLVLADPAQPAATDGASPAAGAIFHYLVRAENACPAGVGLGPLGSDSAGVPRTGTACP